ncbi:MAG TPA: hypothetical protein VGQ36_02455, partial [Thermoanaerobaculia bacterium]|nr:hypothetical protein [Thermoanaerobaculia bacterium]
GEGKEMLAKLEALKVSELGTLSGWVRDSVHFYYVQFKSLPCLQYDGIYENEKPSSSAASYLNFRGYVCSPRKNGTLLVQLEVSSQTSQRGFSEALFSLSAEFFDAVAFDVDDK